ncbi:hypothetical protein CYMTET_30001 [Cymbomonas tetramitiformis]|uniref:Uncharacterized protein n=1 Tax=Cymbomonas tetramitiformis TaxID=36881 RepID=A0AAE0FJV7_9CHLO|nr:hypothetical protein CYMTET_30001 [Cymbomonas tetramitiformis]
MEYVRGALLLVPDALSRRPDYVTKDPREGLNETGVVDQVMDLPNDPLSVLDANEVFEDLPPAPVTGWVASWRHGWMMAQRHSCDVAAFTPFELCYGVSPMSQLDIFLEAAAHPGPAPRRKGGTAHEMAVKFSSQMRDAHGRLELAE